MENESRKEAARPASGKNSPLAALAGGFVRALETMRLRGAPTLLHLLSRIFALRAVKATVPLGPQLISFPAFDGYWCRYLWAGVPFERDVEQIFRKLGKGRVLIDCGANIGFWSVRASEFGFTEVIAVEANANLIPLLRENFRLNSVNGTVVHGAIYSSSGEHLLLSGTDAHAQASIGASGIPVTSIAIRDIVTRFTPGEEFVAKLDVEGAETAAISGATGIENIIFVYEDFPKHGMPVTRNVLERDMAVFAVAPSGHSRRIGSVEEAAAFNAEVALPQWPSNLVACSRERAEWVERQLAVKPANGQPQSA